jgi:hypothetical protein
MTGTCPHCGGLWWTDPYRLRFEACCYQMEEELECNRDNEADMRRERDNERDSAAGSDSGGDS